MTDGEDADDAGQHESQVRLVASFFPGADVRVPENELDLFILCLCAAQTVGLAQDTRHCKIFYG